MSAARAGIDLLVRGAAEIATPLGRSPRGGARLGEIAVLPRHALAVDGGKITAVGPEAELERAYAPREVLDAAGGLVIPGLVDAHTHPVFGGTREQEFELRTRGASYAEIALRGGGILSSVRSLRERSDEELLALVLMRLERFLDLGTTTVEAKSGYGLSTAAELRSLRLLRRAAELCPIEIAPTFLGAHAVPAEYEDRRGDYVRLVRDEMLPAVASEGLAEYCDVFAESIAFDRDESQSILARAKELGLGLRLHADQLGAGGGAQLAAELGAASADHLEHVTGEGIEALGRAGVIPVLCPLVPLFLRQAHEAPAREMVAAGLAPAVSTDFNPGSCYTQSLHEAMTFASLRYRFTAAECLTAATLNAACSLGRGDRLGSLEVGKQADLVVLDLPGHEQLAYDFGRDRVRAVVKRGRVVRRKAPRERAGSR